jgi:sugar phosphate isomerase/epimerase
MSKVVKVDFDGTIVEHQFPAIGEPLEEAFETLKDLKAAGYVLILWTCREDSCRYPHKQYLKEAVEFCRKNGVEFDAVNEAIQEEDFRDDDFKLRKPYAHYHIDDKNLGGFPGWKIVRKVLLEGHKLNVVWEAKSE